MMDDKLKTSEDIRDFAGLATLAVVPIEDSENADFKSDKKKKIQRRKT